MEQIGVKVTMIGVPPLATDLLGAATQASSSDMIIAALGFTTCVPFARAIDQINYSKPVLSTPICTFLPRAAYAAGDIPKWTYGIAQTLVNLPGPQSKLYLKKGIQYGATVNDLLWVFAEGAWEQLLATVKIMNAMPYAQDQPGDDDRRIQGFPRSPRAGAAGDRVRQGRPRGAGRVRQPDPVLQLHGQGQVEGGHGLAEAARGEVGDQTGRWARHEPGPPASVETETGCGTSCSSQRWASAPARSSRASPSASS